MELFAVVTTAQTRIPLLIDNPSQLTAAAVVSKAASAAGLDPASLSLDDDAVEQLATAVPGDTVPLSLHPRVAAEEALRVRGVHATQHAFIAAAASGRTEDMRLLLLTEKVSLGGPGEEGTTAAHKAAQHREIRPLRMLRDMKASFGAVDVTGETPLHCAASQDQVEEEILETLVSGGASVASRNHSGDTPLHCAARAGNLTALVFLVKQCRGCAEAENKYGGTPLHEAAVKNLPQSVATLMALGAAPERCRDTDRETPLHYAARHGAAYAAAELLSGRRGSRTRLVRARNCFGETALDVAAAAGHHKVADVIKRAAGGGASPFSFFSSCVR